MDDTQVIPKVIAMMFFGFLGLVVAALIAGRVYYYCDELKPTAEFRFNDNKLEQRYENFFNKEEWRIITIEQDKFH